MATLTLASSVGDVKGVGAKYLQLFKKNGILTVQDLLLHFPVSYIDFNHVAPELVMGAKRLYKIQVLNSSLSRHYGRRFSLLRVSVQIGTQKVTVLFFNKPYLTEFFKTYKTAYIYGSFQVVKNICQANNPLLFTEEDLKKRPVEPVYTRIGTITSGKLKLLASNIFPLLAEAQETLPDFVIQKYAFPSMKEALKALHFPAGFDPLQIAQLKQRLIYSEFLLFQLELQFIRSQYKEIKRQNFYTTTDGSEAAILADLPFQLTPDQQTVCAEIKKELQGQFTMQRLLQGDVGSGKTIVAFITLSYAIVSGFQGALLAPTEILAAQHFENARSFFKGKHIALLTGSTTAKQRKELLQKLKEGEIDLLIGTHALLTESVQFHNLSMVVIDEQHRFGVSQRAALYYKGDSVDLLVTTATPIPRTMLLSLYNDLAVSTIKTKPAGRLPIITKVVAEERRDEFYRWLRKRIEVGEKAYIILPLIEKSDYFTELRDIETETAYFKKIFKGIAIGIVTGRTANLEKDAQLQGLAQGTIRVLIATTVIEVGIDVKDATVMVIENADRYGLSQLHQLRGRVGRGTLQSNCYLFPSPNISESGTRRLNSIVGTNDGFEIAETDMKMRGGGIISGLRQSGFLDFKVANLQDHMDTFKEARKDTMQLLKDETLQNRAIKEFLKQIASKLKEINFS